MAKTREEIVGKRFLCVSGSSKLKLSKINEWDWRAGVIRACSHNDSKHQDLQVRRVIISSAALKQVHGLLGDW